MRFVVLSRKGVKMGINCEGKSSLLFGVLVIVVVVYNTSNGGAVRLFKKTGIRIPGIGRVFPNCRFAHFFIVIFILSSFSPESIYLPHIRCRRCIYW